MGRIIVGIAASLSGIADTAYLNEISPSDYRGRVSSMYEILTCVGVLLSFVLALIFIQSYTDGWRILFIIPLFLAAIQSIGMCWLPESPKWLYQRGYVSECKAVLLKIYGDESLSEVQFIAVQTEEADSRRTIPGDGCGSARNNEILTPLYETQEEVEGVEGSVLEATVLPPSSSTTHSYMSIESTERLCNTNSFINDSRQLSSSSAILIDGTANTVSNNSNSNSNSNTIYRQSDDSDHFGVTTHAYDYKTIGYTNNNISGGNYYQVPITAPRMPPAIIHPDYNQIWSDYRYPLIVVCIIQALSQFTGKYIYVKIYTY